jgi:hypothetical protein
MMMHGLTNIKYYKHCDCIRGIHCKNPFPVHKPKTWWSLMSIQKWCDTVSKKTQIWNSINRKEKPGPMICVGATCRRCGTAGQLNVNCSYCG